MNAPVQIEAIRAPRAKASRNAVITAGGGRAGDVVTPRHDDRVGGGEGVESVVGADAQHSGGDDGIGSAHQHPVAGPPRRQLDPAEHLDRRGEVEGDGVGQGEHGDGVHDGR